VTKVTINSAPMWLRVAALTIFAASVAINAYFGAHSTSDISDSYALFVTPPAWTFAGIWSTIYLLFAISLVYVAVKDRWPSRAYWSAIVASILNAVWLGVFSIGTNTSTTVCFFIILVLLVALYTLWAAVADVYETDWKYFAVRNVISLYLGWILTATVLNLGMVLVFALGVSQKAFTITFWILNPLLHIAFTAAVYSR
jgi:benzodiazapine receptor